MRDDVGLLELVGTRRSAGRLLDTAPDDAEVERLVGLAMTAPDHAYLRPWRLVLIRDGARGDLGDALAQASGNPAQALKPLRAPLLIAIVLCPQQHPKVPEWEQLAAAVGVVTTLGLLMHAAGWATNWRTGPHLDARPVREVLRLADGERALGFLYTGRPDAEDGRGPRPQPDPAAHLSTLGRDDRIVNGSPGVVR
ncbi:nitroreductase family protein [Streptantibioticus silvisoli]|uniref:Putative NAD(P)H nitroreductase n=1 Tax=Streptantibioticus silvisoli TaxID=2705255 RepID=A0ABT6W2L3_9ACTN|nr:nitroreductase [Streptantibioticus silvisoli]MDI5964534.1 nitroreductase [Streptantibioticus silvisoli]